MYPSFEVDYICQLSANLPKSIKHVVERSLLEFHGQLASV